MLSFTQGTRLLWQPDLSATHITHTYGSDIWVLALNSSEAKRITSTSASESTPTFRLMVIGLLSVLIELAQTMCIWFLKTEENQNA